MSAILRALRSPVAGRYVAGIAVALALPTGCSDSGTPLDAGQFAQVQFEASGFPPLAQSDATFELWISFALTRHSVAASLGRFRIDGSGNVVGTDSQPITFAADPTSDDVPTDADGNILWQLAVDAFVTLESSDDPGAEPEPTLPAVLAGSFLNGKATLDITGGDAIHRDFSSIGGSFHLATPTTSVTTDEADGVWFAAVGGGSASLALPALPDGWVYEGWISMGTAAAVSLGRFPSPDGIDSNGWGPAGDADGYLFPGEDFPLGAGVSLAAGTVFVTLEPTDNFDGEGPLSFLKLLTATAPSMVGVAQTLTPVASFPTVTITIPHSP